MRLAVTKRLWPTLAVLVAGTALAVHSAATAPLGANYPGHRLDVDRTGDAVQALAELKVDRFFATQPAVGPGSVIARAPFAALARIDGPLEQLPPSLDGAPTFTFPKGVFESQRRLYRFGVLACLLALVLLAAYSARSLAARGMSPVTQLLVAAVVLGLPVWSNAINLGHPDEFFTTGITMLAVLAAVNRRPTLAAVLLGYALASKQWAFLAVPAVLWAARPVPIRKTLVVVAAVYLALTLTMFAGDPGRFADTLRHPAGAHGLVDIQTIWFPLAPHTDVPVFDGVEHYLVPHRRLPHALESAIHPLIALLALALSLFYLWRRPAVEPARIFLLLALVFLLRCLLDPVTNAYYHAPFLAALALYEGYARRRIPVLTVIATAALIPTFPYDLHGFQEGNALYLAWSLPMTAGLVIALFRPDLGARIAGRFPLGREVTLPGAFRRQRP